MLKTRLQHIFLFFIFNSICFSQWSSDIRLTNDLGNSVTSQNNGWSIVANGNNIHVVWADNRNGNHEVYYKSSINGGLNWSPDIRLTTLAIDASHPHISIFNSILHIAWVDNRDGNYEIYYKRSTTNGNTWENDIRLTNDTNFSSLSSICVNGPNIHIAWTDSRDAGLLQVYYKRSTNTGLTWEADRRLTFTSSISDWPTIASAGSNIHIAWHDNRTGFFNIFYKNSLDNGNSWNNDIQISNSTSESMNPSIAVLNQAIHIAWREDVGVNSEIFYKHSFDNGNAWEPEMRLTNDPFGSYSPNISVTNSLVNVVWSDLRDGNSEIYYKSSSNQGLFWNQDNRLTNNSGSSMNPSISSLNTSCHIMWADNRDSNFEIYYKTNTFSPPPTQAPILIIPLNNSAEVSLTPFFDWDTVSSSESFNIQISTQNNFNSLIIDSVVALSSYNCSNGLVNNTQYFWRVRAINSGGNGPWSATWNFRTTTAAVTSPIAYEKWISGEKDTIRWTGTNWSLINIKIKLNYGTLLELDSTLEIGYPNGSQSYIWNIAENILSFKTKIIIENYLNPIEKIESNIFRIKPYLLTKTNSDSTYYEYRKDRDQWGFWNIDTQMFSSNWYQQFNYRGIDPYTNQHYSPTQGWFTFFRAKSWNFPDWISMVRTFTVNGCYVDLEKPIYSPYALAQWNIVKDYWRGSCFGIAISNALVFKNKNEFINKYPNFPQFLYPNTLQANDEVRKTINELFTHQTGQPHTNYVTQYGLKKTVKETLNEIKEMLKSDDPQVKTLSFRHNYPDSTGGHAIVVYKLKKDIVDQNKFYIYVSDNANPESNIPIEVNISENNGNGTWYYENFHYWGGGSFFYLRDPAITYLSNPIFNINDSILQVMSRPLQSSILIKDIYGNITGHNNDTNCNTIPFSTPLIFENGHSSYPYGYELKKREYFLELSNFVSDTIYTYLTNGNNSFSYERYNTQYSQVDNLIYKDGFKILNSDTTTKHISLTSIIKENDFEKLLGITSLDLQQNDTVKLELIDSNKHKLISTGSSKSYDILLNFAATEFGEFFASDIFLPMNSSHIFLPNWQNLNATQLIILVDLGNNGTIDDTLRINNQIIGINFNHEIPYQYNLSQNYPNPFNPKTTINFEIPQKDKVKIMVYDIIGKEVTTLINEEMNPGRYKIEWNATQYSSGIYFCKMSTLNFEKTIKIVLLK